MSQKAIAIRLTPQNLQFHLFIISQCLMTLASSIYTIALLYVVQKYVSNVLMNGIIGNFATVAGVIFSFFIGSFVDRMGKWLIMLLADIGIAIFSWIPGVLGNMDPVGFFLSILIIDFLVVVADETDVISRSAYIKLAVQNEHISTMQKYVNPVTTIAGILGYLFVMVTLNTIQYKYYFYIIGALYVVSLVIIFFLPKEQRTEEETIHPTYIRDVLNGLQYSFRDVFQKYLLGVGIGLVIRNQIVLSLIMFYLGKIDPEFHHIAWISLGFALGICIGIAMNLIPWQKKPKLIPYLVTISGFISAAATFILGFSFVNSLNYILLGSIIGLIFGAGLVSYSIVETIRIKGTPNNFQGRSMALRHTCAGILSFILIVILGAISDIIKQDGISFIFVGLIYAISIIFFVYGHISNKYNCEEIIADNNRTKVV